MTALPRILAIGLLALALAACGASTGTVATGTQTPTPQTTPQPTPDPTLAPTPAPTVPPGPTRFTPAEVITVESDGQPWATVVVDGVKTVAKYEGGYYDDVPTRGNVYIQLQVTYTALTDGVTYNPFDWQVFADGLAVDSYAYVANGPEPQLGSGTLPNGRKATGWMVYEVPARGEVLFSYGGYFGNSAPVFEVVIRPS